MCSGAPITNDLWIGARIWRGCEFPHHQDVPRALAAVNMRFLGRKAPIVIDWAFQLLQYSTCRLPRS
jgi:hypothetical protein